MGPAVQTLIAVLDIASCLRCLIANNVPPTIPALKPNSLKEKAQNPKEDSSFSFKILKYTTKAEFKWVGTFFTNTFFGSPVFPPHF